MWTDLYKIMMETTDPEIEKKAQILMDQLNTAGGKELIGHEVENFIKEYHGNTTD